MAKKNNKTLYGDTIVEAVVAIAIYSIVAVLALGSMSSGLSSAQRNLESTMSRSAIDSQSDTLRYYYESYLATKGGKSDEAFYGKIWNNIKPDLSGEGDPVGLDDPSLDDYSCQSLIKKDNELAQANGATYGVFALSGRGALSSPKKGTEQGAYGFIYNINLGVESTYLQYQILSGANIVAAPLYPRITYRNMQDGYASASSSDAAINEAMGMLTSEGAVVNGVKIRQSRVAYKAEGVWIFPKKTRTGYDFFVRTCWNPVGSKSPSTFTSVVRLYDSEI